MRQMGSRTIKVNKSELITKIRINKENHIKEYDEAVIAYKKEAKKQLESQLKRVDEGALDANLNLVTPVNSKENYDKIILMFEMEVEDIVELSQSEFNEYIHDEVQFARHAKMSNTAYLR
jgi:hypothetical protein